MKDIEKLKELILNKLTESKSPLKLNEIIFRTKSMKKVVKQLLDELETESLILYRKYNFKGNVIEDYIPYTDKRENREELDDVLYSDEGINSHIIEEACNTIESKLADKSTLDDIKGILVSSRLFSANLSNTITQRIINVLLIDRRIIKEFRVNSEAQNVEETYSLNKTKNKYMFSVFPCHSKTNTFECNKKDKHECEHLESWLENCKDLME